MGNARRLRRSVQRSRDPMAAFTGPVVFVVPEEVSLEASRMLLEAMPGRRFFAIEEELGSATITTDRPLSAADSEKVMEVWRNIARKHGVTGHWDAEASE